jgi:hypothetical protein
MNVPVSVDNDFDSLPIYKKDKNINNNFDNSNNSSKKGLFDAPTPERVPSNKELFDAPTPDLSNGGGLFDPPSNEENEERGMNGLIKQIKPLQARNMFARKVTNQDNNNNNNMEKNNNQNMRIQPKSNRNSPNLKSELDRANERAQYFEKQALKAQNGENILSNYF